MRPQLPARIRPTHRIVRAFACACLALAGTCARADADAPVRAPAPAVADAGDPVPRDPLELRALTQPAAVLAMLPAELEMARAAGDQRRVALLEIARANACRIAADWACQRDAGIAAHAAADAIHEPLLVVRGLIAESRGRIALQEFARGEQLLGEAENVLRDHPLPDLLADVHLGYSSLYYVLGKPVGAADYADRGLTALGQREVPLVRVRLLRNKARALVQLAQWDAAERTLALARPLVAGLHDPKLDGELELEHARIADARGDTAAMRKSGARILELAAALDNAQLRGQGHEVLGRAAKASGDVQAAEQEWREAARDFQQNGQTREELNALGALLHLQPASGTRIADFSAPLARYLEVQAQVEQNERHRVANELDTRLIYAQQQLDLARLQNEAALASQREAALRERQQLNGFLALLGGLLALILAASFWNSRRSNRRLQHALAQLGESEARYRLSEARLLAVTDNIPANIAHVGADERYTFVNAYNGRLLGIDANTLVGRTVREVRGEALYRELQPHIAAALNGERQTFESTVDVRGHAMQFESTYIPDVAADGACRGFFVLSSDITWRKQAERELDRLARIDSLTGIANRRRFEEGCAEAVARAQRHARPLALLYLDIDRFKSINDGFGHQVGDVAIREFALRLQRCVRTEDLLARLGGDEFAIVLEEIAQPEDAAGVAAAIVDAMRLPLQLGQQALAISASIGVAFARAPREVESLTALADRALYAVKAAGRDGWRLLEFDAGTDDGMRAANDG